MNHSLFNDFENISLDKWKNKVIEDLKGKKFDDTLITNDEVQQISYSPLFHKDNKIKENKFNLKNNSFKNIIKVDCSKKDANQFILDSLMNGAEGIWFNNFDFHQWEKVCNKILFKYIHSTFEICSKNKALSFIKNAKNIFFNHISIICPPDQEIIEILKEINNLTIISDGLKYNNKGANISQELAFSILESIELIYILNRIKSNMKIGILLGIDSNYFYEIAKYRAIRILWNSIIEFLKFNQKEIDIYACTGRINLSVQDHFTNLLRQTTQTMSACIGGANFISTEPYDFISKEKDSKIQRMAKNIPLILKEESYLDKIIDASKGSYFIEWLTNQWTKKSIELIKKIEHYGGIIEQKSKDFINKEILNTQKIRRKLFEKNKIERIGVNVYKNQNLKPLTRNDLNDFFYDKN